MIFASIDIGTNTILLLVVEISEHGIARVLHDEQRIPRLGRDVDANRMLGRDAMERAAACLQAYKATALSFGAEKIAAVGTSALRDARNSAEFCEYIWESVGIRVEILSGDDEARWTFRGGMADFAGAASAFSVLDIGGGSTEVIVGTARSFRLRHSFDVGCVRLAERFLHSDPPTDREIDEARNFITTTFAPVPAFGIADTFVVGVAGTMTTMAALHQHLPAFDPEVINGFRLTRTIITDTLTALKRMTTDEIGALPQVAPGRADIIVAGMIIAETFMDLAGIPAIVVSVLGLRYGIAVREIEAIQAAGTPPARPLS